MLVRKKFVVGHTACVLSEKEAIELRDDLIRATQQPWNEPDENNETMNDIINEAHQKSKIRKSK